MFLQSGAAWFLFLFLSLAIRQAFAKPDLVSGTGSSGVWVSKGQGGRQVSEGNGTAKRMEYSAPACAGSQSHWCSHGRAIARCGPSSPGAPLCSMSKSQCRQGKMRSPSPWHVGRKRKGSTAALPWKTALEGWSL